MKFNWQAKLFLIYLKCKKPLLILSGAIALVLTALNLWDYYKIQTANYTPWQVVDVERGDRFTVVRDDRSLSIELCGITAGDKSYLKSLIDKGDGTVELEKTGDSYEAWVMLKPDYEQQIHLNTWMVQKGKAKLNSSFTDCRSGEELEMANRDRSN